jgi:hypothetical protein
MCASSSRTYVGFVAAPSSPTLVSPDSFEKVCAAAKAFSVAAALAALHRRRQPLRQNLREPVRL